MEEVRAQAQPSHGPWLSPEAKAKGLVLTEDGAAGPRNEKEEVSPSGLSDDAQGIDAEWPRQLAGSVHESLGRQDAYCKNSATCIPKALNDLRRPTDFWIGRHIPDVPDLRVVAVRCRICVANTERSRNID